MNNWTRLSGSGKSLLPNGCGGGWVVGEYWREGGERMFELMFRV